MKLHKFLMTISSVTIICLLYVHQQTEIVRMAYVGEKKTVVFQELLDKNSVLRYNIGRSVSLVQLGSRISGSANYEMPSTYRLVKLAPSRNAARTSAGAVVKESLLSRFFSVKTQAEARTINP